MPMNMSPRSRKSARISRVKPIKTGFCTVKALRPSPARCSSRPRSPANRGHRSLAHREIWIPGKEDLWSEARNDDRIDMIPDKRHWEPGERPAFR